MASGKCGPAVWSSPGCYRYFVCVRTGSTVCDDIGSGMCLLSYFFHAKETCICLPGLYRSGSRYSIGNLWLYRINRAGKSICKISEDDSGNPEKACFLEIMLLPYVVSTCQESLVNAKRTYEKSGLALGLSREYVLIKVILPAIRPGIVASAMMAFGRALGETMAVMMVIGNSAIFPKLLGRGQTLPALTALEMGSIEYGSIHLSVLYVANLVLLVILVVVTLAGQLLKRRFAEHEK